MHSSTPKNQQKIFNLRIFLFALSAMALALFLSACGARVDTVLTINEDGSGSRVISAIVEPSDIDQLDLTIEDIEAAIIQNLPAEMSYEGRSTGEASSQIFTFKIDFADTGDYHSKIINILAAGKLANDVEIEHIRGQAPFADGVQIKESFQSKDLLRWLEEAILATGKTGDAKIADFSEEGQSKLVIDSTTREVNSVGGIKYGDIKRFGFSGIEVLTSGLDSDQLERSIYFDLSRENYAVSPKAFDDWFQSVLPPGGSLISPEDGQRVWVIKFPSASAAEVVQWTDNVLISSQSELAITKSQDPNNALRSVVKVRDFLECSNICLADAIINSIYEVPDNWQSGAQKYFPSYAPASAQAMYASYGNEIEFNYSLTFNKVLVEIQLDDKAAGSVKTQFHFNAAEAEGLDDEIKAFITDDPNLEVKVLESDDQRIFEVETSGNDAKSLEAALLKFGFQPGFGQSMISVVKSDSSTLLNNKYAYSLNLGLPLYIQQANSQAEISWVFSPRSGGFEEVTQSADPNYALFELNDKGQLVASANPNQYISVVGFRSSLNILPVIVTGMIAGLLLLVAVAAIILVKKVNKPKNAH